MFSKSFAFVADALLILLMLVLLLLQFQVGVVVNFLPSGGGVFVDILIAGVVVCFAAAALVS